jgi:hypothetical protein
MTDIIYPDTLLMLCMSSFPDTQRDIYIYIGQNYLGGNKDIGADVKTIRRIRKKEKHGGNDHRQL